MTTKIKWTKVGGDWAQSQAIVYRADRGGLEIIRTRIAGSWTQPGLYRDGRHVRSFRTVKEAKDAAEAMVPAPGKPLTEIP